MNWPLANQIDHSIPVVLILSFINYPPLLEEEHAVKFEGGLQLKLLPDLSMVFSCI